jgi:endonuclease-3 related protein
VLAGECGGDLEKLFAGETSVVRGRLLAIHGVGPETADSMLLYAGGHRSFVIDAYTKRIFERHNWIRKAESGKRKAESGKRKTKNQSRAITIN